MEEQQKTGGMVLPQQGAGMQPKVETQQETIVQQETEDPNPKCLGRFNAGAFSFTWIWGMCNGVWVSFLFFIAYGFCVWLAQLNTDTSRFLCCAYGLIILFSLCFGFRGNAAAWEKQKKHKTAKIFDKIQSRWSIAGWIVLALKVIGVMVSFCVVLF